MLALTVRRFARPRHVRATIASLTCASCARAVNNRSTHHPSSGCPRKQRRPGRCWYTAPAAFAVTLGAVLHAVAVEAVQFARIIGTIHGGGASLAQAMADGGFIVTGGSITWYLIGETCDDDSAPQ